MLDTWYQTGQTEVVRMTAESPAVEPAVRAATGAMTEREAWSWPGVMVLVIGIAAVLGGVALLLFGVGLSNGVGKTVVILLGVLILIAAFLLFRGLTAVQAGEA